jgi:hypothetical protein
MLRSPLQRVKSCPHPELSSSTRLVTVDILTLCCRRVLLILSKNVPEKMECAHSLFVLL